MLGRCRGVAPAAMKRSFAGVSAWARARELSARGGVGVVIETTGGSSMRCLTTPTSPRGQALSYDGRDEQW